MRVNYLKTINRHSHRTSAAAVALTCDNEFLHKFRYDYNLHHYSHFSSINNKLKLLLFQTNETVACYN